MNLHAAPGVLRGGLQELRRDGERLFALMLVAVAAIAFAPALAPLADAWRDDPSESHGFLIAVLVPVLVLRARASGWRRDGGHALAVAALVASTIAFVLARAAHVDTAAWCLVPMIVLAAIGAAVGTRGILRFAAPCLFFLFATPVWDVLIPPLQRLTVAATSIVLPAVGVPSHIEGATVTIPAGVFEIEGGCAGASFLVVALALAVLLGELDRLSIRQTILLVVAAATIAIVANWVRVGIIIYIGHATEMRSPLIGDHLALGWWIFAAAFAVPVWGYRRRVVPPPSGAAFAPRTAPRPQAAAFALAALLVAPLWDLAVAHAPPGAPPQLSAPRLAGWSGPAAATGAWSPHFPGAAASYHASYERGGAPVELYVAYFDRQSAGQKLVGRGASVAGDFRWSEVDEQEVLVDAGAGPSAAVREAVAEGPGVSRLIWSWYEVRGRRVVEPRLVKLFEALAAFGSAPRSGVVAISSACRPDCADARARMRAAYAAGLRNASAGTAVPGGVSSGRAK